jgi:hypothetical protein
MVLRSLLVEGYGFSIIGSVGRLVAFSMIVGRVMELNGSQGAVGSRCFRVHDDRLVRRSKGLLIAVEDYVVFGRRAGVFGDLKRPVLVCVLEQVEWIR